MPDRVLRPPSFEDSILMVEDRMRRSLGGFSRLDQMDLRKYSSRHPAIGWRLNVRTPLGGRVLDVIVPREFPFALPRVGFVGPSMFLKWPHFERDGILCLDGEGFDIERPGAVVADRVESACNLIAECAAGQRDGDFADEILSYWAHTSNSTGVPTFSLLDPRGPSRLVRVWRGKDFTLVAETDDIIRAWLNNRFGSAGQFTTQAGALLWLRHLLPVDFPNGGADIRKLAATAGLPAEMLFNLIQQGTTGVTVLIGTDTSSGPALVATRINYPSRRGRSTLSDGFRNDRIPVQIALARYFGGESVERGAVGRADSRWIHGRGADPRFDRFHRTKVAIVGCGSVGGPIAILLAQSGIGRFVLIDPERVTWANIGRHPLGAPYVGKFKSIGLGRKIRSDFPHVTSVDADTRNVQDVVLDRPDMLADCDLIVSATGSWAADALLDAWQTKAKFEGPIVYGWTEAHASAGHAVVIAKKGRRLREGFDPCGTPNLQITHWDISTTVREPGCGAVFQPYGAVELSFTVAMIAETALKCLEHEVTASAHRAWIGTSAHLKAAGGDWSPLWRETDGFRDQGGFVADLSWPEAVAAVSSSVAA